MRTISIKDLDRLPNKSGIYWAIDKHNHVRYVGQAVDLKKRWSRHEKHAMLVAIGCTKLRYRCVSRHWLDFEEAIDIQRFDPPANSQHPNPERKWNWRMRIDCWVENIGIVAGSFAIALLLLHIAGSSIPVRLLNAVSEKLEERSAK